MMNEFPSRAPVSSSVRIGIQGLPSLTDEMIVGGLYVLVAETTSARFPILASSLVGAVRSGVACTVVMPSSPDLFIQRTEAFGGADMAQAIASEQLQVFVTQDEFQKKMFRYGAEGFVRELEDFNLPQGGYFVFDQADELFSLHDLSLALDQIETMSCWFAEQKITGLLVFSRATASHAGTLNALMDHMSGIARLGAGHDGLALVFDYWQSPEGTIAAKSYRLSLLESGMYEASAAALSSMSDAVGAASRAGDGGVQAVSAQAEAVSHVFYMDPDLDSLAKQTPGVWQRVDTLVSMMHATRKHPHATLILSFQRETHLRQLAEAVHTLRLSLGKQARIVVQEKGASLRYQNEALLLRLGINLVVNRDLPASRLPLVLDSLKGQVLSRDVDINFEAALSSVLPTRLRGYLPLPRFLRELGHLLEQAQTLGIPQVLVVGRPAAGLNELDVLENSRLSRLGDLMSADGERCYLFLNACPQAAMLATLERILAMSVDAAFEDVRFVVEPADIEVERAALARMLERGDEAPDYSLQLAAHNLEPDDSAPVVVPEVVAPAYVAPQRIETPAPKPLAMTAPHPAAPAGPAAPAATAALLGELASETVFDYQGDFESPSFGKSAAPRATRSGLLRNG